MKLEVEHVSGIVVVSVRESLFGDESDELVATVEDLLEEGSRLFALDLSELEKIDSGGIGSLVVALTVVARQGGKLVVVRPTPFFDDPPTGIYRYIKVFDMYDSREEAIAALLDSRSAANRIEPEAQPDHGDIESLRRKIIACLIIAYAILVIGALILLAAWLM